MTAIPYTIRRSDRARRIRVEVALDRGVEVVIPRRARDREAAAAVEELRPWIEQRLLELDDVRAAIAARRGTVPYLGQPLSLVPEPGRARVHRRGEELLVPAGAERQAALERWYRRQARAELEPRVARAAAELGVRWTRLAVRGQRTRWGSATADGALSFNWRLLLAPAGVLDYVVWHEVCHLQVRDHSRRFWALVEEHCPDWREHARWLRRHGAELVL